MDGQSQTEEQGLSLEALRLLKRAFDVRNLGWIHTRQPARKNSVLARVVNADGHAHAAPGPAHPCSRPCKPLSPPHAPSVFRQDADVDGSGELDMDE